MFVMLLPGGIIPASSLSSVILPEVYGEVKPILSERGRHYEIWDNEDDSFTYKIGGVPLWALNPETNSYQPTYHKTHPGGMEEFSNGYISVRAFDDYVSFYSYDGIESKIANESWILYKDGSPTISTLIGTQFIEDGNDLLYRLSYTNPNADYDFDYVVKENKLLDHNVQNPIIKIEGDYTFQQEWDVIEFDEIDEAKVTGKIKHDFKTPKKLNGNVNENAEKNKHKNFSITNNGKLVAFEKIGSKIDGVDESNLLSFEFDNITDKVKYRWNVGHGNIGDKLKFNSGDTLTTTTTLDIGRIDVDSS